MVSDLPFKPSSPAKKGSYGYIKTNLGNKATGLMGEYKYAENVSDRPAWPQPVICIVPCIATIASMLLEYSIYCPESDSFEWRRNFVENIHHRRP